MTGIQADPEVVSILLYLRCVSLYCMYMYGSGLLLSGHALEEKKDADRGQAGHNAIAVREQARPGPTCLRMTQVDRPAVNESGV